MEKAKRLSLWIFLALLAYMPLHIFLSTWIGTSTGLLELTKVAKDMLLIAGFLLALAAGIKQPGFEQLLKDKLTWLILAYGLITLVLAVLRPTDQDAEILGVVYNTRFLLYFLYAQLLLLFSDAEHIKKRALQIVLGIATVVLFIGILQYTILPDNAFSRVGYSRANGVLPAFFIDDKPDLERVMSTLRDPNSLGSYIIIVGVLALAGLLNARKQNIKRITAGLLTLSLLCIWFTFSRSAWLGFMLGAVTVLILATGRHFFTSKKAQRAAIGVLIGLVITGAGLAVIRDSYFVQNVIFHADESTVAEDPNQLRARFLRESTERIANNPVGHGPGTAGLASIRNDTQGTVLNENYYLQIAHETGLLGLILFIGIIIIAGKRLFVFRRHTLALGLFGALLGLVLTNLFVHIWSNEAVAYTWWGLAGFSLGYLRLKTKRPQTLV